MSMNQGSTLNDQNYQPNNSEVSLGDNDWWNNDTNLNGNFNNGDSSDITSRCSPLSFAFESGPQITIENRQINIIDTDETQKDKKCSNDTNNNNNSNNSDVTLGMKDLEVVEDDGGDEIDILGNSYQPKSHLSWATFGDAVNESKREYEIKEAERNRLLFEPSPLSSNSFKVVTPKKKLFPQPKKTLIAESLRRDEPVVLPTPYTTSRRPRVLARRKNGRTVVHHLKRDKQSKNSQEKADAAKADKIIKSEARMPTQDGEYSKCPEDDNFLEKIGVKFVTPPDLVPQPPQTTCYERALIKSEKSKNCRNDSPPPLLEKQVSEDLNNEEQKMEEEQSEDEEVEGEQYNEEERDSDMEAEPVAAKKKFMIIDELDSKNENILTPRICEKTIIECNPYELLRTKIPMGTIPAIAQARSIMAKKREVEEKCPSSKSTKKKDKKKEKSDISFTIPIAPKDVCVPAYKEKEVPGEAPVECTQCLGASKLMIDMKSFEFRSKSSSRPHLCEQTRALMARVAHWNREFAKRLGVKAKDTIWKSPDEVTSKQTGFCYPTVRRALEVMDLSTLPKCPHASKSYSVSNFSRGATSSTNKSVKESKEKFEKKKESETQEKSEKNKKESETQEKTVKKDADEHDPLQPQAKIQMPIRSQEKAKVQTINLSQAIAEAHTKSKNEKIPILERIKPVELKIFENRDTESQSDKTRKLRKAPSCVKITSKKNTFPLEPPVLEENPKVDAIRKRCNSNEGASSDVTVIVPSKRRRGRPRKVVSENFEVKPAAKKKKETAVPKRTIKTRLIKKEEEDQKVVCHVVEDLIVQVSLKPEVV